MKATISPPANRTVTLEMSEANPKMELAVFLDKQLARIRQMGKTTTHAIGPKRNPESPSLMRNHNFAKGFSLVPGVGIRREDKR